MGTIIYGADNRQFALTPTSVQTGAYSANANELALVDTTAAALTVTLPSAPEDGTVGGVKIVAGTHAVTVATAGTDVFDVAGGATSMNWSVLYQSTTFQYIAATGVWVRVSAYGASSGGSGVTTFNGRSGAVAPASGDYSFSLLSGTAAAGQLPSLDALTAPAAAVSMNSHNLTHVAAGAASTDAVNVSQLPSSTNLLPIASGGTGQSSAANAFNALSPLTTIGDTLYGGASGVDTRLAGNTTAAKQFLTQTGTGSASAAPAWAAIASADLPVASGTQAGAVSTAVQTLAGAKTFTSAPTIPAPALLSAFAPVVGTSPTAVTSTTSNTLLAQGLTIPASGLAAGQVYTFKAWGTLSTHLTGDTFTIALYFGGITGTQILSWGAGIPSNSSTVTGAAWLAYFEIIALSSTQVSVSGWDGLNFFPTTENDAATTVSNTSASQLVIGVIPSDSASSITCAASYCMRLV